MPLFQAVRRSKEWVVRVPLWDARECPDCAALVAGGKGQDTHRDYHEALLEWQDWAEEAIQLVAVQAGVRIEGAPEDGGEVDALELRDDEQHDAKRRRVSWKHVLLAREDADEDD